MATVLIAEDDQAVRNSLKAVLSLEGHQILEANDGQQALEMTRDAKPDLLLLDVMMPFLEGTEVAAILRQEGNRIPILMLTARQETSDQVAGLDAGADDYLTKPYQVDELNARVRALLRRSADQPTGGLLSAGLLQLKPAARKAWIGQREMQLSKTEFDLLELLVRNKGIVLAHETIYQEIWDYNFGPQSKNLTVYVNYLRGKLEADGEERLLETVRGVGYVIR